VQAATRRARSGATIDRIKMTAIGPNHPPAPDREQEQSEPVWSYLLARAAGVSDGAGMTIAADEEQALDGARSETVSLLHPR
jgi:hypothetical protein